MIEFGGVVQCPYSDFESILHCRNYPGMRKPPAIVPGQSMRFGRSEKVLRIYDKGKEQFLDKGKYTRLEFTLRGDKITKHYGGTDIQHISLERMKQEFFILLYELEAPGTDQALQDFPKGMAGMLARNLWTEARSTVDPGSTARWYIRVNGDTYHARRTLAKAQQIAAKVQSRTLRDLCHPGLTFVDL